MKKNKFIQRLLIAIALIVLFILLRKSELGNYLTISYLKSHQSYLKLYYQNNPYETIILYFIIYVITTALSFPGATILTLAGGALFGLFKGTIIVSFASTIGATFAFWAARYILRDYIQQRYHEKLKVINEGIKKDGAFYLFSLRLIFLFPFFLINLVMGLTPISTITYFFVSQMGMLAGTIVYVNAGVELSKINTLKDIMSPTLLLSFALIGIFPILGKKMIRLIKKRKVYTNFKRPKKFDYNMVVIGAGSGGLVTAYISAAVKSRVALIEKNKMGGDCLNTGCVPSKALIQSAKIIHLTNRAKDYGIDEIQIKYSFSTIMDRIQAIIKKIEPHDSVERYTQLGVECFQGKAQIISPWEVKINEKILTTKNITIATGASPLVPSFKGLDQIKYLTSDNIWQLRNLPKSFLVLGAGPIGLEMAQSFARLGSKVKIVEMLPRIINIEDEIISSILKEQLEKEGIKILTNHKALEFKVENNQKFLMCQHEENQVQVEFDEVLIAIGRKANTKNIWTDKLNISLRKNGTIQTNHYLQTKYPNIFACGDVTGPYQLTHTASHQAWFCAVNGLFGQFKKFRVDYSVIPWCTYTDPEIATVGLNEQMAKQQSIKYELTSYDLSDLDRAITDSEDKGLIRVLTVPGRDKILGVTIIGNHASDLILEFITAMKNNLGLNKVLNTIHIYPTMGEANKYVAGNWKKAHTPKKILDHLEKFHNWKRG